MSEVLGWAGLGTLQSRQLAEGAEWGGHSGSPVLVEIKSQALDFSAFILC